MADQSPNRNSLGNRRQADTDDEQQRSGPASSQQHPPAPGAPYLEQRQFQPLRQTLPYQGPTSSCHAPVAATRTLLPAAPIYDRHGRDTSQLPNRQPQNQQLPNPQLPNQQLARNFDRAMEQTLALAHLQSQADQHGITPPAQRSHLQTPHNPVQSSQTIQSFTQILRRNPATAREVMFEEARRLLRDNPDAMVDAFVAALIQLDERNGSRPSDKS